MSTGQLLRMIFVSHPVKGECNGRLPDRGKLDAWFTLAAIAAAGLCLLAIAH
jgi:hypothetical protein